MTVFAFVDSTAWTDSVLKYAAWAAQILDQSLTIVAKEESGDSEPAIAYDAYQSMDAREDMYRELSARTRTDLPVSDAETLELVQKAARKARDLGVARVRTATTSDLLHEFIEQSTDSSDLLILPRHDESESLTREWSDDFLKARRRTMLLVPSTFTPIKSWLIAIDGKSASGRSVDFLTSKPLIAGTSGKAVFVGNDYQSRIHYRDAVKHLESAGLQFESHELQGNVEDVLVAVLAVTGVDLLVMGAYGQGRFRSIIEGSTTSRLLKSFRGPVLVSRA